MAEETLHEQLNNLHETLQQTTAVSPETKALLVKLAADIQITLQNQDESNPASLSERLEEILVAFEGDHPQLTAQLQTLLNMLSNMGI
ncbi:MAG: DUF4404 family protein [Anaerolineales bacterium]|nr:DUF4404 family protein [Anaerolineales bacterium]